MWEDDETAHFVRLGMLSEYLLRANVGSEAYYDENGRSYGNSLDLMRKVPPILKTLCVDRTWIRTTTKTSFRKILFKNGMYDGDTGIFHDIRDTPFNPDIVFHVRIDRPFPTNIDSGDMDDRRQRLFFDPLGLEQGQFFLHHLSRGLFGDAVEMGVMFFGVGFSKTGKGTITAAMLQSCGDMVRTLNAEKFRHRGADGGDEAQKMRWALLHRHKRVIISNKCDAKAQLNGNMIKKM